MRVLHVLDHSVPLHSGYAFRTLALLREQRKLGFETLQLTSTKQGAARAEFEDVDGFRFYRTGASRSMLHRLPIVNQVAAIWDTQRRLEEVMQATKPHIIHAHSPCLNGIAALRAARKLQMPVVYEMRASWEDAAVDHGTTTEGSLRYRLSRALETWVLRRADAVTTICDGLRNDILGRGIDAERVTVIANGVDVDAFPVIRTPDTGLQSQLGLKDSFVIGFLGSFYAYEGLDLLIAALPALSRLAPSVKVLLVGGGPERESLLRQATLLGVHDRLVMPGRVPHGDISRYYSAIDLLAFPRKSMRLTETVTPLKPLEAMAHGRILMASNVGGHRELIVDSENGFLFPPDDVGALVAAVQRILGARENWDRIIEQARQYVVTKRTWRVTASAYPAVYQRALHPPARSK